MTARAHLRSEAGSAPAGVLAWIGITVVLLGVLGLLAQVVAAQARAATTADLAALAGADALAVGSSPCGVAAETAERNDARLATCAVSGSTVVLTVEVSAGTLGAVAANARAGPGPPIP